MKKISILSKYLITSGIIVGTIGLTFGGISIYNALSPKFNVNKKANNGNDFILAKPVSYFVSPFSEEPIAILSSDGIQIKLINDKWNKTIAYEDVQSDNIEYEKFYKQYQSRFNGATPIQYIAAGPTKFRNFYVDAISPKEFHKYVEWFMNDISWGPDIATMNSFSIRKNVVLDGNLVTLGSHSNIHKEKAEIVFYPDSFFGSLPLYSIIKGAGNSNDKLLYKLNNKFLNKNEINTYLANFKRINTYANLKLSRDETKVRKFRNIVFANLIKNQDIFVYYKNYGVKEIGIKALILKASDKVSAIAEIKKYDSSINFDEKHLFKTKILKHEILNKYSPRNLLIKSQNSLKISFSDDILPYIEIGNLDYGENALFNLQSLEFWQNKKIESFVNFRDFVNVKKYENTQIFLYKTNKKTRIFKDERAAIDSLGTNYVKSNLIKQNLVSIEVENAQLKYILEDESKVTNIFSIKANSEDIVKLDLLDDLQKAVGYIKVLNPYLLKLEIEKRIDGKTVKEFSIFNQVYDGLLDKVSKAFPHLLKTLTGEHIEKTINEKGEFVYKVVNGVYRVFNLSDRIAALYLLKATDPEFKGVGADFLKSTGAHEYGHHTTLQNAQDNGEYPNSLVGGISPRNGLNDQSFYDTNALKLYLRARSSKLNFKLKSIDKSKEGNFPIFSWDKEGIEEVDDDDLIFGHKNSSESFKVFTNKERRFLQTINSLREAAKLRGLKLYDLFLLNSFDVHSGTLNPNINGKAMFFAIDSSTGKSKFVFQNTDNVKSFLKDGLNNNIIFINAIPQVVSFRKDARGEKTNVVEQVLIFKKNGDPVINVKSGEIILKDSLLDFQIKSIENTILNLIQVNYNNNGWNKWNTHLTGTPSFIIEEQVDRYYIGNTKKYIKRYLKNIFRENELDTYYLINSGVKGLKDARVINKFYNIYNNSKKLGFDEYANSLSINYDALIDKFRNKDSFYWGFGNVALRFNDGDSIDDKSKTISYLPNPGTEIGVKRFILEDTYNVVPYLDGIVPKEIYWGVKDLFGITGDKRPFILNGTAKNRRNISLNKEETTSDNFKLPAYDAYTRNTFDNLNQMVEFASIDYEKISLSADGKTKVWNIDYVKTKFNLNLLKEKLIDSTNSAIEIESRRFDSLAQLNEVANDEQKLANYIMTQFEKSIYNVYIKNQKLGSNWKLLNKIMNPNIGIKYLKNNDLKESNLDFNKFEFNGKSLYDAFTKYLANNEIVLDKNISELDIVDAMVLLGVYSFYEGRNFRGNWWEQKNSFVHVYFLSKPSSDALNYNERRLEEDISQIFTDYVYTFSESLTRDYLQISYIPSKKDLHNLPNYLKGASEANTGFGYFLDLSSTKIWNDSKVNFGHLLKASQNISHLNFANDKKTILKIESRVEELSKNIRKIVRDSLAKFKEISFSLDKAISKVQSDNKIFLDVIKSKIQNSYELLQKLKVIHQEKILQEIIFNDSNSNAEQKKDAELKIKKKNNEIKIEQDKINDNKKIIELESEKIDIKSIKAIMESFSKDPNNTLITRYILELKQIIREFSKSKNKLSNIGTYDVSYANQNIRSNYFGKIMKRNQGFFKDRWQKKIIGWELYDDNGVPIKDNDIRIKDLDGNKVENRARAYWMYLLRSKGVGERTVTGIFRNKSKDTNLFWGFVKKDLGAKIKYLTFENEKTKEKKYLKINVENTNNLFYYKKQGDKTSKFTLKDEGYVSWISEYDVFAKYENALLIPDSSHLVYFADENKIKLEGLSLGKRTNITENGKTPIQSPSKLTVNKEGQIIFTLIDQFNL